MWRSCLACAVVVACSFYAAARANESFVMQDPIPDARQVERPYHRVVAESYCECAKACAKDDVCGAFTYGDGVCSLGTVRSSLSTQSEDHVGSTLTYVTDRCTEVDVA